MAACRCRRLDERAVGAQGLCDDGQQARTAGVEVGKQFPAHARLPEFAQVLGDFLQGLVARGHGLEKSADLVGHAQQVVDVHGAVQVEEVGGDWGAAARPKRSAKV